MSQLTPEDREELARRARLRSDWNSKALKRLLHAIAVHRDRTAYRDFFRRVAPKVKGYALESGYNEAQADHLTQKTMLSVWYRAPRYDPDRETVSVWLFKLTTEQRNSIHIN